MSKTKVNLVWNQLQKAIQIYSQVTPINPQPVLIEGSTMTFQNEHSYDLLTYLLLNNYIIFKKWINQILTRF